MLLFRKCDIFIKICRFKFRENNLDKYLDTGITPARLYMFANPEGVCSEDGGLDVDGRACQFHQLNLSNKLGLATWTVLVCLEV